LTTEGFRTTAGTECEVVRWPMNTWAPRNGSRGSVIGKVRVPISRVSARCRCCTMCIMLNLLSLPPRTTKTRPAGV